MKKLLLLMAVTSTSFAVAQSYSFSTHTESYTNLTGATSVNNGQVWDDPSFAFPIGFNFQFYDTVVNELSIFADGLGGTLMIQRESQLEDFLLIAITEDDIIDRGYNSGISQSEISYKVDGNPGSRILKLEWENAGFYDDTADVDFINLQLWLFEGSNIIEMHYGPNSVQSSSLYGNDGLIVYIANNFNWNGLTVEEGLQLTGSASLPDANQITSIQNTSLAAVPENGRVYRFTPQFSAVNETLASYFRAYPNPVSDKLMLEIAPNKGVTEINLFDNCGKKLKTYDPSVSQIDFTNFSAGLYFVEVLSDMGPIRKAIIKD